MFRATMCHHQENLLYLCDTGIFYVIVDLAPLYNQSQMKPTSYTLLLSIFISTSLHVSGYYVPIIRRICCIYATLVFFYVFVDFASLYNQSQMKPTKYTLLLSIFISTSVHVSGYYVPIMRRTYCIYAKVVIFTLYGWREPPIQSKNYKCRIDTASSPHDGHIVARNM